MQFYISHPTNSHLADLALLLTRLGRPVRRLPLADLPSAQPVRLGPLRLE